jgi:hypothetical protein
MQYFVENSDTIAFIELPSISHTGSHFLFQKISKNLFSVYLFYAVNPVHSKKRLVSGIFSPSPN